MFIDIHTHILPSVDDGAQSIETSIKMLEKEIEEGVAKVILTPHVQSRAQKVDRNGQILQFETLKSVVLESKLPIEIYLGAEILYRSHLEPEYEKYTLGNSKYVLVEFSMRDESPVEEIVYDISRMGFIPIVAHIERYPYLTTSDYEMIKKTGALIQVNTSSILGLDKAVNKKKVLKMIKEGYVDLISSDCHDLELRKPNLKTCYTYLKKHIDEEILQNLFYDQAQEIIDAMS